MHVTKNNIYVCLYLVFLLCGLHLNGLYAQEVDTGQPIKVGVYVSPPFVIEKDGGFTGMSIELWEALAGNLGLSFSYDKAPTFGELIQGTEEGRFDIAVTNLTITQDRARRLDFTQPWYDAGLRIMIDRERSSGWRGVITGLSNAGHLRNYCWLAFLILLASLLLTVFDRKFDKSFPRSWREGFAENFYHVMSLATSGKAQRKNLFGWSGRIFSGLWLVCGVGVLAYVTSSLTSVMTTQSLTSQINSIADLPGKRMGVLIGSESERYARERGLAMKSFEGISNAVSALRAEEIDAIIGDAPVLEYHKHTHADEPIDVVGPLFKPDKYGFGFTRNNGLEDMLTVEVLGAHERGLIEELRRKYFGQVH